MTSPARTATGCISTSTTPCSTNGCGAAAWRHFERLLDALLDDPDRPIAAVDILTDDERQALAALNATDREALPRESVVAMFEATWRRRSPSASRCGRAPMR